MSTRRNRTGDNENFYPSLLDLWSQMCIVVLCNFAKSSAINVSRIVRHWILRGKMVKSFLKPL